MAKEPKQIAEHRKNERQVSDWDMRQAFALEHIADTLEAIRIDLVGYQTEALRAKK